MRRIARTRTHFKHFLADAGCGLPEERVTEVITLLEESVKRWEIVANISLKLGISKKMNLIDDMQRHLSAIIEIETSIVEKLSLQPSIID